MNLRNAIWLAAAAAVCIGALYLLLPAYADYARTQEAVAELERSLRQQELEIQDLRRQIGDLRTDRRAVERVAREKFGMCREGEKIYHFDPVEESPEGASAGQ